MNFTKKCISTVLCCLCIISLCASGVGIHASGGSYSWYCKRKSDHTQPRPDKALEFIEQYDGYYVDKKHGDSDKEKVIYLTFDAGYENGNIAKILDVLKEENVSAAFFILSNLMFKNPDVVLRMANEGHTVGNHTSKHGDVTKYASVEDLRTELSKPEAIYRELTGGEMSKFFRPPEGRFSEQSMRFTKELGYKTVFWSFAYADWDNGDQMSEDEAFEKIMSNIHNGEIMLLHPTSATNAAILGRVIRALRAEGYRFGTLDEL